MHTYSKLALALSALLCTHCGGAADEVRANSAKKWSCSEDDVRVTKLAGESVMGGGHSVNEFLFCSSGCGHEALVLYVGSSFTSDRGGGHSQERWKTIARTCDPALVKRLLRGSSLTPEGP